MANQTAPDSLFLHNIFASITPDISKKLFELFASGGLPEDSLLSVLVVEIFGNITNIWEHINKFNRPQPGVVEGAIFSTHNNDLSL